VCYVASLWQYLEAVNSLHASIPLLFQSHCIFTSPFVCYWLIRVVARHSNNFGVSVMILDHKVTQLKMSLPPYVPVSVFGCTDLQIVFNILIGHYTRNFKVEYEQFFLEVYLYIMGLSALLTI
jgi:hypothetical protein